MVEMSTGSWSMALPVGAGGRRTGAGPCQNDDWVARQRYPTRVGPRRGGLAAGPWPSRRSGPSSTAASGWPGCRPRTARPWASAGRSASGRSGGCRRRRRRSGRPPSGRTRGRSAPGSSSGRPIQLRDRVPRCWSSQTCQSWRLVRSQNAIASDGSKPGAAIVAGSNSHSQTIRVWPGAGRLEPVDEQVVRVDRQERRSARAGSSRSAGRRARSCRPSPAGRPGGRRRAPSSRRRRRAPSSRPATARSGAKSPPRSYGVSLLSCGWMPGQW